jgi:hypothetical protein
MKPLFITGIGAPLLLPQFQSHYPRQAVDAPFGAMKETLG